MSSKNRQTDLIITIKSCFLDRKAEQFMFLVSSFFGWVLFLQMLSAPVSLQLAGGAIGLILWWKNKKSNQ